jgi:hypothetical protein
MASRLSFRQDKPSGANRSLPALRSSRDAEVKATACRFRNLPIEIRNMVYRFAARWSCSLDFLAENDQRDTSILRFTVRLRSGIPFACRQTYEECMAARFYGTEIYFPPWSERDKSQVWPDAWREWASIPFPRAQPRLPLADSRRTLNQDRIQSNWSWNPDTSIRSMRLGTALFQLRFASINSEFWGSLFEVDTQTPVLFNLPTLERLSTQKTYLKSSYLSTHHRMYESRCFTVECKPIAPGVPYKRSLRRTVEV